MVYHIATIYLKSLPSNKMFATKILYALIIFKKATTDRTVHLLLMLSLFITVIEKHIRKVVF